MMQSFSTAGFGVPTGVAPSTSANGFRTTIDVSSEGRETEPHNVSADFTIDLPREISSRPLNSIKLLSLTLPESRRGTRTNTVLPLESSVHLADAGTITIDVTGEATRTLTVPPTLAPCTQVSGATHELTSGGSHGMQDVTWPHTPKFVYGGDAEAVTATSSTQFTTVDSTGASARYLYHPPCLPSELVAALDAALSASLAGSAATVSFVRETTGDRAVRLYLNRDCPSTTITFSTELGRVVLGRSGAITLVAGEPQRFTPAQDFLRIPPGSYTSAELLSALSFSSGIFMTASGTIMRMVSSAGEVANVTLPHGMYFGTRLAAAVAHGMHAALSEKFPITVQFDTSTGKFTLASTATFEIGFSNAALATSMGFVSTRLVGKSTYVSDRTILKHADDFGFILAAEQSETTGQASVTPLVPTAVYLATASTSAGVETQVKIDGTLTPTCHGFKENDVVVVRRLDDDTERVDVLTHVSTAADALGTSTPQFNTLQLANYSAASPVSVRLLSSALRSRVVFNCTDAAVASVGGKHAPFSQFGLSRTLTEVIGTTEMPGIMNTSDPTSLAIDIQLGSARVFCDNFVYPSDDPTPGREVRVFATVQARTQERMVEVSETLRSASISSLSGESQMRVRILDARDMKLMEFGNGAVRIAFAFTGPARPSLLYETPGAGVPPM